MPGGRDNFSTRDPKQVALFSFLNMILDTKVAGTEITSQQSIYFCLTLNNPTSHQMNYMKYLL